MKHTTEKLLIILLMISGCNFNKEPAQEDCYMGISRTMEVNPQTKKCGDWSELILAENNGGQKPGHIYYYLAQEDFSESIFSLVLSGDVTVTIQVSDDEADRLADVLPIDNPAFRSYLCPFSFIENDLAVVVHKNTSKFTRVTVHSKNVTDTWKIYVKRYMCGHTLIHNQDSKCPVYKLYSQYKAQMVQ